MATGESLKKFTGDIKELQKSVHRIEEKLGISEAALSQVIYPPAASLDDNGVLEIRIDVTLAHLEKEGEYFAADLVFADPLTRFVWGPQEGDRALDIMVGNVPAKLMQPELRNGSKGRHRLYFRTTQEQEAEFIEEVSEHGYALIVRVTS